MNTEYYKKFEPVFNSWNIKRLVGEGSYGKVFEIEREDFGTTYKAALKVMTIPSNESEIKSIMADGMNEASVRDYYEDFVEEIVKEFVLMSKLKGNSNVVSYEDHMVIEHKKEIGWDILIRMELLTPLFDYIRAVDLKRKDVIQLGIDMCKALELCQKYNIIHRDIKPENIFISENGDYKLGDFGIARTLEQTSGMLSKKGTQAYMAPEIYREESYGSNVDIYSLGIVMYRLLNENRTPFLPAYPAPITHSDRESAIKKRISGAPFLKPTNADGRLAEIVLKACAYNPKERYFSPMEMREELEAIFYNKEEAKVIYPKGDETPIKSLKYIKTGDEIFEINPENRTEGMLDDGKINEVRKQDSTGKTEGMFGKKHINPEKTESGFDCKISHDEKTEGIYEAREKRVHKKKSIWKSWTTYVSIGAISIAIGITSNYFLNRESNTVSCSVQEVNELSDPIELKLSDGQMTEKDYDILIKRLEAFGSSYYIDKENGSFELNKKDLGKTNQEILATVHMIAGIGEIKLDSSSGTKFTINIDDIDDTKYSSNKEKNLSSVNIKLNQNGKDKLLKIISELDEQKQEHLICLYVDGNLRCNNAVYNEDKNEITIKGQYDGKDYIVFNPFKITANAEETDSDIVLSPNYIRLLISIINEGKLSKNYDIIIDERYGITVDKPADIEIVSEPESEPEHEAETVYEGEQPQKKNTIPSLNKTNKDKSAAKQQQQPTQQPIQQQSTPQPQNQQPVQQQPTQQQPQEAPPLVMGWD